jgi:hypothetical protein
LMSIFKISSNYIVFTNSQLNILVIKIVHWCTCSGQLDLIFWNGGSTHNLASPSSSVFRVCDNIRFQSFESYNNSYILWMFIKYYMCIIRLAETILFVCVLNNSFWKTQKLKQLHIEFIYKQNWKSLE